MSSRHPVSLSDFTLDRWRTFAVHEQDELVAHLLEGPLGESFQPGGAKIASTRIAILIERASGAPFFVIPGASFQMGFGEEEGRALLQALEARGGSGGDREAARDLIARASFMRPVHEVTVAPFLLARKALAPAAVHAIVGGPTPEQHDDAASIPAKDLDRVVAAIEARGLRLPSEAEWELAYRAGTTTPFPWGVDLPVKPSAPRNDFAIAAMGLLPELCADSFHPDFQGAPSDGSAWIAPPGPRVVRGGAGVLFPWQGSGELLTMLSAFRSNATEHGDFIAIRPVKTVI